MIPAAIVSLERIPLTPNGKVDRQALPEPDIQGHMQARYVEPRTESEQVLARIWAQVLNLPRVGIEDNFFELGGHSLVMVNVLKAIKTQLDRDAPIVTLFKYPTVSELARYLDSELQGEKIDKSQITVRASRQRGASVLRRSRLVRTQSTVSSGDKHD
jgi:acyl carrier protein